MPWFVRLAAATAGFLGTFLLLDYLRRRIGAWLSGVQVPRLSLKNGPSVPDEFSLRLAKTIIEGKLDRAPLRKKPFVDFFPKKSACPHCGGKRRNPWDLGRMERLLADTATLARQIKQGGYCLGCLGQLSNLAAVGKKHLVELKTGDPRSLSTLLGRGVRVFLLLLAVSLAVSLLSAAPGIFLLLLKLMVNLPQILSGH